LGRPGAKPAVEERSQDLDHILQLYSIPQEYCKEGVR
jgi:hypothetical protein